MKRREFIQKVGFASFCVSSTLSTLGAGQKTMYGIIGKMIASEGNRDKLIEILLGGTKGMPGCINYVISKDSADPNALWITEVWESQESHEGSLSLPSVQEAISKGKPLIAGFGERHIVEPVGGQGI